VIVPAGPPDGAELVARAWAEALEPDPQLSVWEWAEANVRLTSKDSAEPGSWSCDRVPYTREIQEALSATSTVQQVTVCKGAQLGLSTVASNLLGYVIDQAPGPMLVVLPTVPVAERYSKQRLATMIRECDALRAKVREARSKDSGNSLLAKDFPGGFLVLAGSNSAAGLRQMPARVLIMDELDGFAQEAGDEGDPLVLAERATTTFGSRRKVFKISTPTFEGRSRIVAAFLEGDRRFYSVPCPRCGDLSPIAFSPATRLVVGARKFVRYDRDDRDAPIPESARLRCEACDGEIQEHEKTAMLAAGRWVPTFPDRSATHRSYHLSALYSPLGWKSWAQIVEAWSRAQGSDSKLRPVVNQQFGEPWRERGESPPWQDLYRRRERYPMGVVPARACVLTAGVDVQPDRVEIEVHAWSEAEGGGLESWSVDYKIVPSGPEERDTWSDLERILSTPYPHATGAELGIERLAIDTGHASSLVYAWVRRQSPRRVSAVKGRQGGGVILSLPKRVEVSSRSGKTLRRGLPLYLVGVDEAKATIYSWLRLPAPLEEGEPAPPGYMHFPEHGEEYFRQLTAERMEPETHRGLLRYVWKKTNHERNEVLDCNVYALSAAYMVGIHRWSPERWREARDSLGSPAPRSRRGREPDSAPGPEGSGQAAPARAPGRGGYLSGYKGKGWLRR
jgi:phage terminase large subunit GpA-like protein